MTFQNQLRCFIFCISAWAAVSCKKLTTTAEPTLIGSTEAITSEVDAPPSTVVLSIFSSKSETQTYSLCSGVVVSRDLVLTAAHCIANPEQGLREPGLIKVQSQSLGRTGLERHRTIEVKQWKRHPAFTRLGPPDIALLHLAESIELHATPVALAPIGSLTPQGRILLAGYGQTNTDDRGGALLGGWAEIASINALSEFTIQRPENGASPYYGDSGGPAYKKINGLWFAAGLVSRGNKSGRAHYTDLSSAEIVKWIKDSAQQLGAQPPVANGVAGMGRRPVRGAPAPEGDPTNTSSPAPTTPTQRQPTAVLTPTPPSAVVPSQTREGCGSCRSDELKACIATGQKDCYPKLNCTQLSGGCDLASLRICLDHAGGNACYPKWGCAVACPR